MTLVFTMSGCGTGKQLAQKNETAESCYRAGNYNDALSAYREIIVIYENNNNSTECPVYTKAGESALKSSNAKLAIVYLKKAKNTRFANEGTYFLLSRGYEQIDNLSLEIGALSDYLEKYPDGKEAVVVKTRLFHTYVESDNLDKALDLWPDVHANGQQNIELLEAYFKMNKGLDNTDACNNVTQQLLGLDADNIVALTWFGKQYYRKAEDRYQKEMKAYEKKKTNKQYRILLKALDMVTADFKKSLTYFKKLYTLQPTPENANYLGHIYGRLSNKKKEAYYKELAKQ